MRQPDTPQHAILVSATPGMPSLLAPPKSRPVRSSGIVFQPPGEGSPRDSQTRKGRSMPRKSASLQADTLNNIRDSAFQLFGRSGYDGVSIDAIAKSAG